MFKKFLQEIIDANSEEELMGIFYRKDGIDMMYQKEKLSWKDHQMLLALINKLNMKQEERNMRFLVRYRFVGDHQVVGVYRTAESVEDAFNTEKRMWKSWGKEIEFVEGFRVKQSCQWWLFSFAQVQCGAFIQGVLP